PVFDQSDGGRDLFGPPAGFLTPFHVDSSTSTGECTNDITHDWRPQHESWNGGAMDSFLTTHMTADAVNGPMTMGYYTRADLAYYYALADAFTICDGYHCSVIGPTDPNRLMSMSATLDPAGTHGGPLLKTLDIDRGTLANKFSWTTMPERLQAHGVSWKVYTSPKGGVFDNVLPYFKPYTKGSVYARRGLDPTFPADFMSDLQHNRLPKVSWLLPGVLDSEHPGFSSANVGE